MDVLAARFSSLAGEGGRIALLDLTRLQSLLDQDEGLGFVTILLSPAEARLFTGFTYPKRRLEWLGGRLAAKHCLSRHPAAGSATASWYRDYSFLPDGNGRPHLDTPPGHEPAPAISISHSREYAAALVTATSTCGIDIQRKTAQLAKVQERFASEAELALLQRIPDQLTRLGMIWAAKEAVKKCLLFDQPTFFGTISLTEIACEPQGAIWTACCRVAGLIGKTALVRIAEFGDYLIACTEGEEYA
jgi:phosphopantetheinyl transferase (holo-ACP synthase)